jgi:hypothetical protein
MSSPTKPALRIVRQIETIKGKWSESEKNHIMSPPTTTNSPWARLIIDVALYMILNPMPTSAYTEPTVRPEKRNCRNTVSKSLFS